MSVLAKEKTSVRIERERKSCKCSKVDINQNNKNWEKMNTKYKFR